MKIPYRAKLKAGGVHLAVSMVIFLALVPFIYFVWYPQPYFATAGGWHGVRIVALVDLVLGPALTLIAFAPGKSRRQLAIDYTFIAACQAAALVWGVYAVNSQRPVAVVYDDGVFQAVTAAAFEAQDRGVDRIASLSAERPPLVFSRPPRDSAEAAGVFAFSMVEGVAKHEIAYLFEPLAGNMGELLEAQAAILATLRQDAKSAAALAALLAEHGLEAQDIALARFSGRYGEAWMVLSRQGRLIDII